MANAVRLRWLLPLLLIVGTGAAGVAYIATQSGDREVSAAEVRDGTEAELGRILDELAGGGTLRLEIANYARDRTDEGLLPPSLEFPDRTVERIALEIDDAGMVASREVTIHDAGDKLIATLTHDEKQRVYTSPSGETFEVPGSTGPFPLDSWLNATFSHGEELVSEHGFETTGSSSLSGMDTTVFSLTGPGNDGATVRREFEVAIDNPLYHRSTLYEVHDLAEPTLLSEIVILSVKVEGARR